MLSDLKRLEHKIGDKIYHFTCAPDSPLADVKEALVQFLGYINNLESTLKTKAEEEAKASVPVVTPDVVETPKE